MRWLTLLIVLVALGMVGPAHAVPQPDAEAAYARGDYATASSSGCRSPSKARSRRR